MTDPFTESDICGRCGNLIDLTAPHGYARERERPICAECEEARDQ